MASHGPQGDLLARFTAKVLRLEGEDACWLWTGASTYAPGRTERYGVIWRDGKHARAHQVALELAGRPCPTEGLEVDHACQNTLCVNPAHLEWVTPKVNTLRSDNPCARNARKTHCKRGHELAGDNLRINPKGERICRACERTRALRYYHERKAA